ncbi:10731_t:CDS:2 [Cetraspora pellucida]|uniref:10731_t:CDS:1 n=1 Tax=Cetraspora pellucida TaxID=1433469 RepID=A0ACA9L8R5_9GLOM|nr:10731_t:CDS:2 [Cetraspora pellucida]
MTELNEISIQTPQEGNVIKTSPEIKYFLVESKEKYKISDGENQQANSGVDRHLKHQIVKFFFVKLNEEYKLYQKNMKFSKNLYIAEIFISLISIFLGQLFALAEESDIMPKVGTQLSTLFGAIGVLVTITTVYLNNTAQKYLETGSSTETDQDTFKLMHLHINDKVIEEIGTSLKNESTSDDTSLNKKSTPLNDKSTPDKKIPEKNNFNTFTMIDFLIIKLKRRNNILYRESIFDITVSVLFFFFILAISIFLSLVFQVPNQTYLTKDLERTLRLSLTYLGGIWIVLIILSKSYDFIEDLEFRVFATLTKGDIDNTSKKIDDNYHCRIKYEKKNSTEGLIVNNPKKSDEERHFHIVRLRLYPLWVTNIELILNGIKPIIKNPYEQAYKYKSKFISIEVYDSNRNEEKEEKKDETTK